MKIQGNVKSDLGQIKKKKSKIKIKKLNKCYAKCWVIFWFRRNNYWFFRDYSFLPSKAKYKAKYERGIKILVAKQMLQRLVIALEQVKAYNTSENLLN